jgi:hypothetical protein
MPKLHEMDAHGPERPLNGLGSAVLLLPVLSAVSIGLWVTSPPRTEAPPARTTHADEELRTAVWAAQVPLADGSRLDVRVSRLQADEQRQAFDREALARRFGLGTGEAWRCEVARRGGRESKSPVTDGDANEATTWPALCVVTAAAPHVIDREGPATRALEFTPDVAGDPLLVLFRPPDGEIAQGTSLQFVQWGRLPGAGAELVGLAIDGTPLSIGLSESEEGGARLPASVASKASTSEEE